MYSSVAKWLLADRAPMSAQLGTDLTQGPALGVQVGCAFNVHGATATAAGPCVRRRPPLQ
jgi:hypothetical protein